MLIILEYPYRKRNKSNNNLPQHVFLFRLLRQFAAVLNGELTVLAEYETMEIEGPLKDDFTEYKRKMQKKEEKRWIPIPNLRRIQFVTITTKTRGSSLSLL